MNEYMYDDSSAIVISVIFLILMYYGIKFIKALIDYLNRH